MRKVTALSEGFFGLVKKYKGAVLNQITLFRMDKSKRSMPNRPISADTLTENDLGIVSRYGAYTVPTPKES